VYLYLTTLTFKLQLSFPERHAGQIQGLSNIRVCFKGDTCSQKGLSAQISKVTVDLAQSLCSFRAHDIDPDALLRAVNPFDETPVCGDGVPCVQGTSHMYDMLPKCQLDKRCNVDRYPPGNNSSSLSTYTCFPSASSTNDATWIGAREMTNKRYM